MVTTGEVPGSLTKAFSVDVGYIKSVVIVNIPKTGIANMIIIGAGLGQFSLTQTTRKGNTKCEGTEWESETSVRCMVGQGARTTRRAVITAGKGLGTMSQAWLLFQAATRGVWIVVYKPE